MTQPPLANLFAVHDPDPAALDEAQRDLERGGEFACVWRPAPGWVAAAAPLPGGTPDDDLARQHQLAFAEGRDRVVDEAGEDVGQALRRVADLADQRPDQLATLPGDFGFIRFRADGDATVVRSCGGLVPFYLKQSGNRCAIATRLGDMVRYLPDEPRLDPLVNAVWTASWGMFPEDRTFLEGVSILARGHYARLGRGAQIGRYWDPRPQRLSPPTRAQAREHPERLRALLLAKLARDLHPDDGNLLAWSGGVDSSSLGALATRVLGRPVSTFTLLPSEASPELLAYERSYLEPLAQHCGFARRWEVHFHERLALDLWRAASPIVFHVIHPALCSLPGLAAEAPVRVYFGGEFADEVCGSVFTLPDWARDTSLWRLLTAPGSGLRHPRLLGRWARRRGDLRRGEERAPVFRALLEADLGTWQPIVFFHPAVQQEYRAWWEEMWQDLRADTLPWRYLARHCELLDAFVPMNWEACSALGIRRSFPFFNREVLELAFECHPTELYGPDTKKLLRTALHHDVPAHNLYRPEKGRRDLLLVKSMLSQREPWPLAALPEELTGLVCPEWFDRPPEELNYAQFRYLTRLTLFVSALRARRGQRHPP